MVAPPLVQLNIERSRASVPALVLGFTLLLWGTTSAYGEGNCQKSTPLPFPLRSHSIDPGTDYCSALRTARPGDEFIFAAGNYNQPCAFDAQGSAEHPIVIRSASREPSQQARFTYSTAQYRSKPSNFFEVQGRYVVLKDLYFTDNAADIVIRLLAADHVAIENDIFDGLAGQAITANASATRYISIRNNIIKNIGQTAIYLGHHEGAYAAADFLIEGNYIDASNIHHPFDSGYAAEVKVNSWGTIRDNSFFNAQGPDLMVYGNRDPDALPNIVDGNYLERSRKDASLNIGGGPARVINNVIINPDGPAVFAQDFRGRDLQRGIRIASNTLISFNDAAISVEAWRAGRMNVVAGNALYAKRKFRPSTLAATVFDNIECGAQNCFSGSARTSPYGLLPANSGLLAAPLEGNAPYPNYDFAGNPRTVNRAGAFTTSEGAASGYRLTHLQPRPPRSNCAFD